MKFKVLALLLLTAVMAGLYGWWHLDLRWRPNQVTRHQAEIARILEQSGWVSPGFDGPKLYMVGFRSCPDCMRFKLEQWPKLHTAKVDTRIIEVARADLNGVAQSTPAERSAVAELWVNRSWALSQTWDATPIDAWTARGIIPADTDVARTAVIEAGRDMVTKLRPLLKANGITFAYPLLIWWDKDGTMRGCACEKRETQGYALRDLVG